MRHLFFIAATALLCTACAEQKSPPRGQERWFKAYQSDSTYQTSRPPVHAEGIHSPTGRAHPF